MVGWRKESEISSDRIAQSGYLAYLNPFDHFCIAEKMLIGPEHSS